MERYIGHSHDYPDDDSTFERRTTIETLELADARINTSGAQTAEQVVEAGSITLAELRP